MTGIEKSYDGLQELIIRDQLAISTSTDVGKKLRLH